MRLFEGTPFDRPPHCDRCGAIESECTCEPEPTPTTPPEKQTLRVAVEQRKGKRLITVVRDVAEDNDLKALLTRLKSACGAGGTIKEGVIELQGDQRDAVKAVLKELKYRIRG